MVTVDTDLEWTKLIRWLINTVFTTFIINISLFRPTIIGSMAIDDQGKSMKDIEAEIREDRIVKTNILLGLGLGEVFNWKEMMSGHGKQFYTDEQALLYHLLSNYEKSTRPVRNASHPVIVRLGVTLVAIFDMDEKRQVLTTNVWLDQEWTDELLKWDPAEFNGIESFRIPCDLIWLPDVVLYNNADDYSTNYMRSRAMIYHSGTVFWPPPTQLRSTCKIDVTYFPFDTQRCYLKFGSWIYHGFELDLRNRSETIDLSNYVVNGEFDLVKVIQRRRVIKYTCCEEPYPDVVFVLYIRRKLLYYMVNVVFPCALMSALTLLVFRLPPGSGEKIALGITVLLAFSVFTLAVAEKMPETSESYPLIGIYLTAVITISSLSVIMTVCVLNLHHRGPFHAEVPHWVRYWILNVLRRMLCMPDPKLVDANRRRASMGLAAAVGASGGKTALNTYKVERLLGESLERLVNHSPSQSVLKAYTNHCGSRKHSVIHTDVEGSTVKLIRDVNERAMNEEVMENFSKDWRMVAEIVDRLLFWLFLVITCFLTSTLLLIIPLIRRSQDLGDATDIFESSI